MSKPNAPKATKRARDDGQAATELAIPVGSQVIEILDVAYRARRPVLLEGTTGIGKSQIVAEFAALNALDVIVLDLSLLEPPDLVGLPTIRDGRTHYASPAELPTSGRGVLMLEELNRAEIPVMQPALQLLSARRLHAYELPPGWMCVAAVNPEEGDYHVNRLDPALRTRFLQLSVAADRESWLHWASRHNVHPVILRIVDDHADAFAQASPRSWAYASELLHALRPDEHARRDLVHASLRGYLPAAWALLLTDALAAYPVTPTFDGDALFSERGPEMVADLVGRLKATNRLDAITMVASKLRHVFAREADGATLAHLERLVASLPGDLRDQCLETAVESAASSLLCDLAIDPAALVEKYEDTSARELVRSSRQSMQLHRVRLVVVGVLRWLRDAPHPPETLARSRQLKLLAEDAGSTLAHDLQRWLRTHDAS